jgi:hypothetical protein
MIPLHIGISLVLSTIQVSDPTAYIIGQESKITEFKVERITSEKKFLETWAKHYGVEPAQLDLQVMPWIGVNFETHEVVAVFAGFKVESAGVEPVKVVRLLSKTLLIYKQSKSTALDFVPEGHPYGFIVIPRAKGEIILLERKKSYDFKTVANKVISDEKISFEQRARLPVNK